MMSDFKFAVRQLLKHPGFTAVAVLTLALGIGVNTSMFMALQALINRALPYSNPQSLVQVFQSNQGSPRESHHSVPDFLDYQASGVFEFMAALNDRQFSLVEPGQPAERVRGLQVSADLFPLLGVGPQLGRVFTRDDDRAGNDNVVILDHSFWQRRFAGDTNIIGRVLRLDGQTVTVIGLMPERFHDVMLMGPVSLWRPIAFSDDQNRQRGNQYLKCIARLKRGMSLNQAQAAANTLAQRHRAAHEDASAEKLRLELLAESTLPPEGRTIVWSIMALAGFVLLIACANLANLQFARTSARSRELAIRGALGAPRARLIRQLLSESLLLALVGGGLGVLLSVWSNELLRRLFVFEAEGVLNLQLNLRALVFAFVAACGSGLVFGLLPALLASRADVTDALKQGSRGTTGDRSHHRIQHSLIVAEVSLALMLLVGASLVVSGLRSFASMNPGWRVDGMSLGYLSLPETKYGDGNSLRTFARQLTERLTAVPGVESMALCWNLPIRQFNVASSFSIDGRPEPAKGISQTCNVNGVTPGYFQLLGMSFIAGRDFEAADDTNRPPVVIISEKMARSFWPNGSALGQRINGAEIVGIVGDVRFPANPANSGTPYQTYRPFSQEPRGMMTVAIRGRVRPETLRRVVSEIDPDLPVGQPGSVSSEVDSDIQNWAAGGKILSAFASLGLSLAALGIYGVITGFVARRTGEIGIRMALGARISQVLWFVVGLGMRLSIIGTAIGLIGAFAMARLLASVLPELPPANTVLLIVVALFLVGVAMIACLIPARRAARIDPVAALRND